MPLGIRWQVSVRGDREVLRACDRLPGQAEREVKDGAEKLARTLANRIRAAGRASSRQSAAASRTVRTARGLEPQVVAGPHPLLFGSEFGAKARFGWYRKGRYHASPKRQFRRHVGNTGYWFFPTIRANEPEIREAHRQMADAIVRDWGA